MSDIDRSKWDRETAGYVAELEDAVVGAAAVIFEEITGSEANYGTECIHLMASRIVNTVPRLAGAYKGADPNE